MTILVPPLFERRGSDPIMNSVVERKMFAFQGGSAWSTEVARLGRLGESSGRLSTGYLGPDRGCGRMRTVQRASARDDSATPTRTTPSTGAESGYVHTCHAVTEDAVGLLCGP